MSLASAACVVLMLTEYLDGLNNSHGSDQNAGRGESNPAKSGSGIGPSVPSPFRMRNAVAANNPAVAGADPGTASSFGGNEIC